MSECVISWAQQPCGCDVLVSQRVLMFKSAPSGLTQWLTETHTAATRQRPGLLSFVIVTASSCYQPTRRQGATRGHNRKLLLCCCCNCRIHCAFASSIERWDGRSPYGHIEIPSRRLNLDLDNRLFSLETVFSLACKALKCLTLPFLLRMMYFVHQAGPPPGL